MAFSGAARISKDTVLRGSSTEVRRPALRSDLRPLAARAARFLYPRPRRRVASDWDKWRVDQLLYGRSSPLINWIPYDGP